MKRQVKAMLKEKKRLARIVYNRFYSLHKPYYQYRCFCRYMFLKSELKKWGVK